MDYPQNYNNDDGSRFDGVKTIGVFAGLALGVGASKAIRAGDLLPGVMPSINKYRVEMGRMASIAASRVPGSADADNVFEGGLFRDLGQIDAVSQKTNLQNELRREVINRYSQRGREGELTVQELLDSVTDQAVDLKSGEKAYITNLGSNIKRSDFEMLTRLSEGDNAIISKDSILDKNLFVSQTDNKAYRIFGSQTLKSTAQSFNIPGFGNPLDMLLTGDTPIAQSVSIKDMINRFDTASSGAVIGGKLYSIDSNKGASYLKDVDLLRVNSSAGRAARFIDPRFSEQSRMFEDDAVEKLAAGGYYDKQGLQNLASPVLESKAFKNLFGDQSFVYRGESYSGAGDEILPLTAKLDQFASKVPILRNFSSRFTENTTFFKSFVKEPIENLGKDTTLYPTDPAAAERLPTFFEFIAGKFSSSKGGSNKYVSMTRAEADAHYSSTASRTNVSKLEASRRDGPQYNSADSLGKIDPDVSDIAYNVATGAGASNQIRPKYMAVDKTTGNKLRIPMMQAMNTTLDLFERTTGLGVKSMTPEALVGLTIGASTSAYILSEALGFFDYLLEKANPFGDVGVKKTALYIYAAARTAQQQVLNWMSPLFAANEAIAPGSTDSLLGHGIRGAMGAIIGQKLFGGGRAGNRGFAGGVAGLLMMGTMGVNKDAGELWDEYMGNKLIDVRESRFWGMGPQDWMGGDVKYQRKSLIAMELDDSRYDHFGGKGMYFLTDSVLSMPLRMAGGITGLGELTKLPGLDPYAVERRNYYNNPYPVTGNMFENTPIIGPLLGSTIGQIFKPTKIMHAQEMQDYYSNPESSELQDIARSLGQDFTVNRRSMPRLKGVGDSVGASLDNMMDLFGLRGFVLSSAKAAITGNKSFVEQDLFFADSGVMTNISDRFYENELGGMLGMSELTRRLLTRNKPGDKFNPLDPDNKNMFYSFERSLPRIGDPRAFGDSSGARYNPGSGITSDTMYNWNLEGSLSDRIGIPYLFGKMYSNKTPLELYKSRVRNSADFYDWGDPGETIVDPYFRDMKGEGALTGGVMGGALYFFGRSAVTRNVLGIGGSVFGVGMGLSEDTVSKSEQARRDTEEMYDFYQSSKVGQLKAIASKAGRGDLMFRLGRVESKTMAGLDYSLKGAEFLQQAYAAMPESDRRFLMDFANAPISNREEILEMVPEYFRRILIHTWASADQSYSEGSQEKAEMISNLNRKYDMPSAEWAGWDPGVDMDQMKLASVFNGAADLHDYGFWGSDERDMKRNYSYLQEHAVLPYMGQQSLLASLLSGDGATVTGSESMPSVYGRDDYNGVFTNDRSNTISGLMSNNGRF